MDIHTLITEFEQHVGLPTVEARRSAFIALAAARGWNNARIGRYLGISRHRVGQKLEKYATYVQGDDMPLLKAIVATIDSGAKLQSSGTVAFNQVDWENDNFALGLLAQVAAA